jgi:two-component system chemotaxis response regulator CheY
MADATSGDSWYALVADDDDDFRTLVCVALRRAGFQVCEARDGEELVERYAALRILTSQHLVIVSDIAMPGRDGVAATAALRNASAEVPILLVTGESSPSVLGAARAAGATRVLSKPCDGPAIVAAVRVMCR